MTTKEVTVISKNVYSDKTIFEKERTHALVTRSKILNRLTTSTAIYKMTLINTKLTKIFSFVHNPSIADWERPRDSVEEKKVNPGRYGV